MAWTSQLHNTIRVRTVQSKDRRTASVGIILDTLSQGSRVWHAKLPLNLSGRMLISVWFCPKIPNKSSLDYKEVNQPEKVIFRRGYIRCREKTDSNTTNETRQTHVAQQRQPDLSHPTPQMCALTCPISLMDHRNVLLFWHFRWYGHKENEL